MSDVTSTGSRAANIQTLRTNFASGAPPTNSALVTVSAGTIIVVTGVTVAVAATTAKDVDIRIGFGLTTTPTGAGVVFSNPGIGPESHIAENAASGGMMGEGADNEDLRITGTDPLDGSYDIVVRYYTRAV